MKTRLLRFSLIFLVSVVFGQPVIAGQTGKLSLGKQAKLTTWDAAGKCGINVDAENLHLKLVTNVNFPCKARQFKDGSLVSYSVEGADEVFILCGKITDRKDKNPALKNNYYEGQGYQAVVIKHGKVLLSEYKDSYCTPHSFEAPQHALLIHGKLDQIKPIEFTIK